MPQRSPHDRGWHPKRFLIRRLRRAAERRLRVPADYLEALGATSTAGVFKFLAFLPFAGHRGGAPRELVHAARIVATQHEDCGPCVQIAVNAALDDGVEPAVIRAILDRDRSHLSAAVALAVDFAGAVAAGDASPVVLQRVEQELGASTLAELAIAVATARVFPTLKRGLGFATSCSLVAVELPNDAREGPR